MFIITIEDLIAYLSNLNLLQGKSAIRFKLSIKRRKLINK